MNLKTFKRHYHDFTIGISQTQIVSLISDEVLSDFPKNLPNETKENLVNLLTDLSSSVLLHQGYEIKAPDGRPIKAGEKVEEFEDSLLFMPTLKLYLSSGAKSEQKKFDIDFSFFILTQELVMLFSYLDAFLLNCLRAIAKREEKILKRDKTITWKEVITARSREEIVENIIEEYCYEFGWKNIRNKIETFKNEHGLEVSTSDDVIESICEGANLRHLVVHNGARINQDFLNKNSSYEGRIGDQISINKDYLENLSGEIFALGGDVFISTARKYYDAEENDLNGIWMRKNEA
jgi:hypothetical protein